MELTFIEVVQSVVLPTVTVITGYFGWKATAEKNKLKAEVEGMKASNTEQEIKNQSSWIDLYKKLHDDQAARLSDAELKIQELTNIVTKFEYAFKKYNACPYAHSCPIQLELSKSQDRDQKRGKANRSADRQREPP